jgi:membrane-associated phospholipid phosphatase
MLSLVYPVILFFDSNIFYLGMIAILMLKPQNRSLVLWGIIGAMLDLLLNIFLKGLFKIPLASHLHFGYAFPSGHLQLATFIYLWLAYHRLIYVDKVYFCMIPLIAITTVASNYHSIEDVSAGIVVGSVFFLIFKDILECKKMIKIVILSVLGLILNVLIRLNHYIPTIVYLVNLILIINLLIYSLFNKNIEIK